MHHLKHRFVLTAILLLSLIVAVSQIALAGVTDEYANEDSIDANTAINATELLVFEVNRQVTRSDRGFPRDDPPKSAANGNWTSPVNYAQGVLHYRVQVRNQPRPQNMRMQFCAWQDRFYLENCGKLQNVSGTSGTVVTWSQPVQEMWRLGGRSIDWTRARQRYGIAIKNSAGDPISDYNGWNWNGENPDQWYPLDVRITVVVVAKGATFSGWQNYGGTGGGGGGGNNPTATPTPRPTNTPNSPGATATNTPSPTNCSPLTSLLQNPGFEARTNGWSFYASGSGHFTTGGAAYECNQAATIQIDQGGNNIQLYQTGFRLEPNSQYRLRFAAKSNSGHDMDLFIQEHDDDYTNYGLSQRKINLTSQWQEFSYDFTTSGFNSAVTDTRIRFWFSRYAQSGDLYMMDKVTLEQIPIDGPVTIPPTPTPGSGGTCIIATGELQNPSYEDGTRNWSFYTAGRGSWSAAEGAYECETAARIQIDTNANNIQLYQSGFTLQPNTRYHLSFAAKSSSGHDMGVYIQEHDDDYSRYGLSVGSVGLTNSWKVYSYEFNTEGFNGTVSDTRLRFWFAPFAAAGDIYMIDQVVLEQVGVATAAGEQELTTNIYLPIMVR